VSSVFTLRGARGAECCLGEGSELADLGRCKVARGGGVMTLAGVGYGSIARAGHRSAVAVVRKGKYILIPFLAMQCFP